MVWRIKEKDNLGACVGNNKDIGKFDCCVNVSDFIGGEFSISMRAAD
ncbi:hypothetical protein [uncultured Clostridium sp.]|nr:hypothetical protein [uncultured Clostridium sp.]